MSKPDLIENLSIGVGLPLKKTGKLVPLVFREMGDAPAKDANESEFRTCD